MNTRECPSCAMDAPNDSEECPFCGYEFPVAKPGVKPVTWLLIALMVLFAIPVLAWIAGMLG